VSQLKRVVAVGLGALVISVPGLACGGSSSTDSETNAAGKNQVVTFDFGFRPKQLTVPTGATVTWENTGSTTHNVKGKGFFSDALEPGRKYSFRFTKPGRYPYLCTLHPTLMEGTIVVSG